MTKNKIHVFWCILFIALLGCSRNRKESSGSDSVISLNKIMLTELDGAAVDFSQYKGKTVFINFWATWCKPCLQEMPTIANIQDSLKNKNIVFLMASNEDVDEIKAFAEKRPYPFHYVRVTNLDDLGILALPTTFIFNADGNLKFSDAGYRRWDDSGNANIIFKIMEYHEQ